MSEFGVKKSRKRGVRLTSSKHAFHERNSNLDRKRDIVEINDLTFQNEPMGHTIYVITLIAFILMSLLRS